jgi:hypothetical protein
MVKKTEISAKLGLGTIVEVIHILKYISNPLHFKKSVFEFFCAKVLLEPTLRISKITNNI